MVQRVDFACTLNHRQASKLDQLVTIQCMAINTPVTKFHYTASIYDGSLANSNMPFFRGRPLHYVATSRTSIHGDKLGAYWTFNS